MTRFFGSGNIPSILTSLSLKNDAYFDLDDFEDFSAGIGLKGFSIISFFSSDVDVLNFVDSTTVSASLNDSKRFNISNDFGPKFLDTSVSSQKNRSDKKTFLYIKKSAESK